MRIVYTESATAEFERFQSQRKEELELFIKNKKYIFGDDVIEITASDIRDADKYFKVVKFSKSKLPLTNMLLKAYSFIGVAMVVVGLFYQSIIDMINQNPIQLTLVLGGVSLSLASFLGSYYFRMRESRRSELERRYREFENRKVPEDL